MEKIKEKLFGEFGQKYGEVVGKRRQREVRK